jgi:hypothetical protein
VIGFGGDALARADDVSSKTPAGIGAAGAIRCVRHDGPCTAPISSPTSNEIV